jgi:HSP20 family protein
MALLPARRGGTLTRPGSQAASRWDPFAEFEELYQRMGQLMGSAFDGMWQPIGQAWSPLADLTETGDVYLAEVELPGISKDWVLTVTVPKAEADKPRRIQITTG